MEFNKAYWRKTIKKETLANKKRITPEKVQDFFDSIERLDLWRGAEVVALYCSLSDEIETAQIVEKWSRSKIIVLPIVTEKEMEFYEHQQGGELHSGAFGILEPLSNKVVNPQDIDLIIIPGIAFDISGNRLGRGKGYYDKYLKKTNAYKIGVALQCQVICSIPHEEHDVKMDTIMVLK